MTSKLLQVNVKIYFGKNWQNWFLEGWHDTDASVTLWHLQLDTSSGSISEAELVMGKNVSFLVEL